MYYVLVLNYFIIKKNTFFCFYYHRFQNMELFFVGEVHESRTQATVAPFSFKNI